MNGRRDLTEAVRRRGLRVLLCYTFFMVAGFAMLMPLVSVHFVSDKGLAAALVGAALAVRQMTQQGLAVGGGMLSDRFGVRPTICCGVLLRAAGFAALAFAEDASMLFAALILSALGGALFEAPYQAAIAGLSTPETRPRYYALSNWVSGVATTVGPLIGAALLHLDFRVVCLAAAACFLVNFGIALLFLPPLERPAAAPALMRGVGLALRNKPFMTFTAMLMGYWFISVQINISFPLLAERLSGSQESVGLMFAVSAGMTVALQYHLLRLVQRSLSPRQILVLGLCVMALSAGAIGLVKDFALFLVCVAWFAVGAILVRPSMQTLAADLADPRALGSFLGVNSISLAIGGAVGNVAGGWLLETAWLAGRPALPWLVFCAVGLTSAACLALRFPSAKETP
jgi:MFS transporter, DHA1 family, multidrug resistance protein